MSFEFRPHDRPHPWSPRRYQPIIAKEWAYSVLWSTTTGDWQIAIRSSGQEVTRYCSHPRSPVEATDFARLVAQVNSFKLRASGKRGGAFRVTEYGQVVVPSTGGGAGSAECVGVARGVLTFSERSSAETFDLAGSGLRPGDPWVHPVVAFRCRALPDGRVSFTSHPEPYTQERLVTKAPASRGLRPARIDPGGGFTFHVNDQGVAVQKDDAGRNPVFIGTIPWTAWFAEESCG